MAQSALNLHSQKIKTYIHVEDTASIIKLRDSNIISDILPSKFENASLMDKINQCFGRLNIQSSTKFNEEKSEYIIVGEINSIITTINTVVVKPVSLNMLLYLGTPLFLKCRNIENTKDEYNLLGYIDDIFGSVAEPMYSITIKSYSIEAMDINAEVYCFFSHPKTLQMYLEYVPEKKSKRKNYKIQTKRLNHGL